MLLLLLAACGPKDGEGTTGGAAADYASPPGAVLDLVPAGQGKSGQVSTLSVTDATWDWEDPQGQTSSWPWAVGADGLSVNGELILPARTGPGSSGAGVSVTDNGATEVYYGTFDDTVTVEIDAGSFAGTAVFARGLGPIVLTLSGVPMELAYYQGVVIGE